MFEYLRRQRQAWKRLREVRRDERQIESLIGLHRFDLMAPFKALGITVDLDPTMEVGAVLYYTTQLTPAPVAHVRLHPHATSADRRMALGMFLIHLSVTHADKAFTTLAPYIVYGSDLDTQEGPSNNEQWVEHLQAMDLLLPVTVFRNLCQLFPLNPAYAMMRVMDVSHLTISKRAMQITRNIAPILPKNFTTVSKQYAARRT